jgi:hypothetical protein
MPLGKAYFTVLIIPDVFALLVTLSGIGVFDRSSP